MRWRWIALPRLPKDGLGRLIDLLNLRMTEQATTFSVLETVVPAVRVLQDVAAPDVSAGGTLWRLDGATAVASLRGVPGQVLRLVGTAGTRTLTHSAALSLTGGVDLTPPAGAVVTLVTLDGLSWVQA